MPTFARLVGAVLLAVLGVVTAMLAKAYLQEGEPGVMMIPVAAVVGVLVGWIFTGRQLDGGKGNGIAIGLSSAVLLAFWVALLFAIEEMIDRAMRNSYGGSPTHAVQDVFDIIIAFAQRYLKADVILALGIGGVVVGGITSFVGRHFR